MVTQIAELIRAIAWPLVVLLVVLLARRQIVELFNGIGGRLSKISVAGIAVELTQAQGVDTGTSQLLAAIRDPVEANAFTVTAGVPPQSKIGTLKDLIRGAERTDYAVIDLGDGSRWLSSRLYIFAAMLRWALGVQEFVFVETVNGIRQRFLAKAPTGAVCLALGDRYPWLAQAFETAAQQTPFQPTQYYPAPGTSQGPRQLPGEPSDWQAVQLIEAYLRHVQAPAAPAGQEAEWVPLRAPTITHEHAHWLNGEGIDRLLGHQLDRQRIVVSLERSVDSEVRLAVAARGHYVATVDTDARFQSLLDRYKIAEAVARRSLPPVNKE